METFYTIIKITPNALAGDTLSIGLLLRDVNKFRVHFSEDRKALARRLLDTRANVVDYMTKQIEQKVSDLNRQLEQQKNDLFTLDSLITSERISHLSDYSNGILRFSEPTFLNDIITDEKFIKLFQLLIDKAYVRPQHEIDTKEIQIRAAIQTKLLDRVKNQVHTNLNLTPDKLPGLHSNFNIECLGLNGALIGAKAIPFHKKFEVIDKELGHYFGLILLLNDSYSKNIKQDAFYIIGEEPLLSNRKEHKTWENIKKNRSVTLIHPEEVDKVAKEIEDKKARTFLPM